MLFNRAVKHDFMPELHLNQNSNLEVVEEMKLVGFQLRTDLKTISNTNYIVKIPHTGDIESLDRCGS